MICLEVIKMKKYSVWLIWKTGINCGIIEANTPKEAEEKAGQIIERDEIESEEIAGDKFEIKEIK